MSNPRHGDCTHCARQMSGYCEECEHVGIVLYDYWEPLTKEDQEEQRRKRLENIPAESISAELPKNTLDAYESAKIFTELDSYDMFLTRPDFAYAVYFGEDFLVASDSFRLIEIRNVEVPVELRGKMVLDYKDGVARYMTGNFQNPFIGAGYRSVMEIWGGGELKEMNSKRLSELTSDYSDTIYAVNFAEGVVHVNKRLFDGTQAVLAKVSLFSVRYRDKSAPLRFDFDDTTMIVLPVKV